MASKNGPRAVGTDGYDFQHRQKIASQYHLSAINKSRLKCCIFAHFLLFLLMCAKLLQDVLDSLDIFVMELEELELPKPDRWEYVWASSMLFSFVGLSALRRNRPGLLQFYVLGVGAAGVLPVAYAAAHYFGEMWEYVIARDSAGRLERWQGFPVAVLWYVFVALALQVHAFSAYFAFQLLTAWKFRGSAAVAPVATTPVTVASKKAQ